jgi:hypothetical protein
MSTPIDPLPPVPNVFKIIVSGTTTSGYGWSNIFHYLWDGTSPSEAVCNEIASAVATGWTTSFVANCPPDTVLTKVEVVDLTSEDSASGEWDGSVPGTSTADKLPGNVAVLCSKTIVRRYRGGRPRTYFYVGADENLQDEAHWNDAFLGTMTENYNAWTEAVTGISEGGCNILLEVCVSYYGGAPTVDGKSVRRDVPLVLDIPSGAFTFQAQIASQRGRIGRRR